MAAESDLRNIYRMLQALDDGQERMLVRMDGLESKMNASVEDRVQIKAMLAKLDDPDIGRVARAEESIRGLRVAMDAYDRLKDRGMGMVVGVAVVLLVIGIGFGQAVRKIGEWLWK